MLDDIADKYNNIYYAIIKMKLINVKSGSDAKYNVDSNVKDAKFKIGDNVSISKYKSIFSKGHPPNWLEKIFVTSKIKNTVPWTYVSNDLMGEEFVEKFCKKGLEKTI